MDPTRPVLDLYKWNKHSQKSKPKQINIIKQQNVYPTKDRKSPSQNRIYHREQARLNQMQVRQQISKQEKYRNLSQQYAQSLQQINRKNEQIVRFKQEVYRLKQLLQQANARNDNLSQKIIEKNEQLGQAYREIQNNIKKTQKPYKSLYIEQLQTGLRQAINTHFGLLEDTINAELYQN